MIENYYNYLEKLLLLQFHASEEIKHNSSKGEIREKFLRDLISREYKNTICHKGFIVDKGFQSRQTDIIITSKKSSNINIGGQSLVYLNELEEYAFDIKAKINEKEDTIKKTIVPTKIGLFAYNFNLERQNFLHKFGYSYDEELDSFEKDNSKEIKYNNIDFVVSLNFNSSLNYEEHFELDSVFIIKDSINEGYNLVYENPIESLFRLIRDINEE